jgi:hypothetical protein
MESQILVPFNSHVRIRDIISVIETAAKPEMTVVFLVRYPTDISEWLRDHWVTTESRRDAMSRGRKIIDRYSLEGQRALAEEMLAPWRHALQKMEVRATVDVYTGSLSSVVENYSRRQGISLLPRARNNLSVIGFFRRPIAFIPKTA